MITQDFSRDIYQELKKLDDGSSLFIISSEEYIAQKNNLYPKTDDLQLEDFSQKVMSSAENIFKDIYNQVNLNTYSGKVLLGKDGIKIIVLGISEDGINSMLNYITESGIYKIDSDSQ